MVCLRPVRAGHGARHVSVKLYTNPQLADFYMVCHALCEDEREQYRAFAGEDYDPATMAAAYFLRDCPKWVLVGESGPLVIGGFDMIRPGVWQDWLFSTPEAWSPPYWRSVTKACRRVMDGMLNSQAHRLQCLSLASRTRAHEWYRPLGLRLEGTLREYGVNGEDALMFARLRSSNG